VSCGVAAFTTWRPSLRIVTVALNARAANSATGATTSGSRVSAVIRTFSCGLSM
jgi:hypothetical protein